jgi:Zn-dependent M32 family carboxypeptidase
MKRSLIIIITTIVVAVTTIVTALATLSGCVQAVGWACHTFGNLPVYLAGAFAMGATLMNAVDRARLTQHPARLSTGDADP